jgi:hypothetical protein
LGIVERDELGALFDPACGSDSILCVVAQDLFDRRDVRRNHWVGLKPDCQLWGSSEHRARYSLGARIDMCCSTAQDRQSVLLPPQHPVLVRRSTKVWPGEN